MKHKQKTKPFYINRLFFSFLMKQHFHCGEIFLMCMFVYMGARVSLYVRALCVCLCAIRYLPQAPWPWSVCIRKANSAIMMTALSFSFPIAVSLSLSRCLLLCLPLSLSLFFLLSDLSVSLER